MRRILIVLPFVLNLAACVVFLVTRPPARELIDEREQEQRHGWLALSSGDPYMLIAERPLRQWNEWHGGETTWVKVIEILNAPALIATKIIGDAWAASHAFSGPPTYRRDSWIRAYLFVVVSSAQWLLIGALLSRITRRRRTAPLVTTPAPPLPRDARLR